LLGCGEKEGGGAIAKLLKRILCVAGSESTGEIVEKRQARARIYIFADQVTARGIRMVA